MSYRSQKKKQVKKATISRMTDYLAWAHALKLVNISRDGKVKLTEKGFNYQKWLLQNNKQKKSPFTKVLEFINGK